MPQYLAFLRGMNLGKRRVKMDDLRARFAALKYRDVDTFIASGNVAFDSPIRNARKLEAQIEKNLAGELGYQFDTFVRTRAEVVAAVAHPAFSAADLAPESNTIHVGFLKDPLTPQQERLLVACRTPVDEFAVNGREFYWLCRARSVDSLAWNSAAMKAVKLPTVTMRNLRMLRKLIGQFPA